MAGYSILPPDPQAAPATGAATPSAAAPAAGGNKYQVVPPGEAPQPTLTTELFKRVTGEEHPLDTARAEAGAYAQHPWEQFKREAVNVFSGINDMVQGFGHYVASQPGEAVKDVQAQQQPIHSFSDFLVAMDRNPGLRMTGIRAIKDFSDHILGGADFADNIQKGHAGAAIGDVLGAGANLYLMRGGGVKGAPASESLGRTIVRGGEQAGRETAEATFKSAGSYSAIPKPAGMVRGLLRDRMGLNGDLAAKVESKVTAAEEARLESLRKQARINGEASEEVGRIRQQAAGDKTATQQAIAASQEREATAAAESQRATMRITADAAQAVAEEEARVRKPFIEIGEQLGTKPMMVDGQVVNAAAMRAMVLDAAEEMGIQKTEVPTSAFKSLGHRGLVITTTSGRMGEFAGGDELTFHDLTRFREDLYDAAQRSSDGTVKAVMTQAFDRVSKLQQDAATAAGVGEKYASAKRGFMQFKRELGSGTMDKFLRARDMAEQAVTPRLAALTTRSSAEGLRNILAHAGVDVGPLQRLLGDIDQEQGLQKSLAKQPAAIESRAQSAIKEARSQQIAGVKGEQDVLAEQRKDLAGRTREQQLVPGMSNLDLGDKTNLEIKQLRYQALTKGMAAAGIRNPYAFVMIVVGMARMAMGSPFGAFTATLGAARAGLPALMESEGFQNWLLKESGVDPARQLLRMRLRQGMTAWAAELRRQQSPATTSGNASRPSE